MADRMPWSWGKLVVDPGLTLACTRSLFIAVSSGLKFPSRPSLLEDNVLAPV
jgi:hypothetical protein